MPNIAVTPEQLQSVASQLNAGAANIESTLSQLAGQVAPLQSEWQGVAQARFQELWAEWQRSSRGIQEALHGISQLTQQAGANYAGHRAGHRLVLRALGRAPTRQLLQVGSSRRPHLPITREESPAEAALTR